MSKFRGYLESISHGVVTGWAWDPANPEKSLYVEVTYAGGQVVRTRAGKFRGDLEVHGIGTGHHGFSVSLPIDEIAGLSLSSNLSARIVGASDDLESLIEPAPRRLLYQLKSKTINTGQQTKVSFLSKHRQPETGNEEAAYNLLGKTGQTDMASTDAIVASLLGDLPRPCFGKIISVKNGQVEVQIDGAPDEYMPMLFVGGKPAWQVPECHKISGEHPDATGYKFSISGIASDEELSLWVIHGGNIELCEKRRAHDASFETAILSQMSRAAKTAQQQDAVAITCWDGAHNVIGRAKVLYDVLKGRRPVVLFCFLMDEFGGEIWPPLSATNENIVTIPWSERFTYFKIAKAMGLKFNTVWICKPRAPSFQLAAQIAHRDAKLILDMDDNEEHFSRSEASRTKVYGLPSIGLSRNLMANVKARTAASGSLVKDFDAVLVRHARKEASKVISKPSKAKVGKSPKIKIGFIGTARAHKCLLEAARMINFASQKTGKVFELHVYGDVQPEQLCLDLKAEGACVQQNIPAGRLKEYLSKMDIILTGFPSDTEAHKAITKYQISSKIGDALSVGRPVLVPVSPSVEDLKNTRGVYLFTQDNFSQQLLAAAKISGRSNIKLPSSFTLNSAYKNFLKAERVASIAQRSADALATMPKTNFWGEQSMAVTPTLFLIWKQHDSGLYGRRVDMVARAYRKIYPDHRVVVMEFLYPDFDKRYRETNSNLSESPFINDLNIRKQNGNFTAEDGTEYRQIYLEKSAQIGEKLFKFMASNQILPSNTVVVLFPNILHLERLYEVLFPYPLLTDFVDNQLSWASEDKRNPLVRQYFALSKVSDKIVFNSLSNLRYFQQNNLLTPEGESGSVIPNWYILPKNFTPPHPDNSLEQGKIFNVFYSGNMNDRMDWKLLAGVASLNPYIRLHLIGEASRTQTEIAELLENPNVIYHGVLNEDMTLELLGMADLTIMPHVVDLVSTFMNPLKVFMYAALNLQTISTNIPGIVASEHLKICTDHEAFLTAVRQRLVSKIQGQMSRDPIVQSAELSKRALAYTELINSLRQTGAQDRGLAATRSKMNVLQTVTPKSTTLKRVVG